MDDVAQVLEEDEHEEARVRVLYLAVDSTGFSSTSASTYYTRVLEFRKSALGGHRRGVPTRRFLKQTAVVETRKQLIVAVKFRRCPANDSLDFIWTLKKVRPAGLPVKLVVADKGYDAESNHEYAQDVLGARTAILVRAASRPKIKMRGRRRKRQAKDFDFGLLARGIHFHPDKPFYTCTEHTDEDVDQTLKVAEEVLKKMKS